MRLRTRPPLLTYLHTYLLGYGALQLTTQAPKTLF